MKAVNIFSLGYRGVGGHYNLEQWEYILQTARECHKAIDSLVTYPEFMSTFVRHMGTHPHFSLSPDFRSRFTSPLPLLEDEFGDLIRVIQECGFMGGKRTVLPGCSACNCATLDVWMPSHPVRSFYDTLHLYSSNDIAYELPSRWMRESLPAEITLNPVIMPLFREQNYGNNLNEVSVQLLQETMDPLQYVDDRKFFITHQFMGDFTLRDFLNHGYFTTTRRLDLLAHSEAHKSNSKSVTASIVSEINQMLYSGPTSQFFSIDANSLNYLSAKIFDLRPLGDRRSMGFRLIDNSLKLVIPFYSSQNPTCLSCCISECEHMVCALYVLKEATSNLNRTKQDDDSAGELSAILQNIIKGCEFVIKVLLNYIYLLLSEAAAKVIMGRPSTYPRYNSASLKDCDIVFSDHFLLWHSLIAGLSPAIKYYLREAMINKDLVDTIYACNPAAQTEVRLVRFPKSLPQIGCFQEALERIISPVKPDHIPNYK